MVNPPEPQHQYPLPTSSRPEVRASDADRDRALILLREHLVVGRLTLDEFSERVRLVLASVTHGDLLAALVNLPDHANAPIQTVRPQPRRWFVAVLSGSKAKGRWRIDGPIGALAIIGGCKMDLCHAEIEGEEIVITAIAVLGGIKVTVPPGFDVEIGGFSILGGRKLKLGNTPHVPGSPRIRIPRFTLLGGIKARSQQSSDSARSREHLANSIESHRD